MPPKRKSATAEAEKPAKAVKTTKATKTAKATNASKTTKTETAGKAAKAEKVPKPTSQSGAKKTATKATTKATTSKENNSSRTLNENEAISIHTPEFTMGNKNSTPKEGSVRSRGAKVDNTNGSTYRSTLKDNNNTLGSKQTSKPNTNPSTNSSTKKLFNPERCYSWFKTYTGLEEDEDFDKEKIGPDGISKLCEDINVSLETLPEDQVAPLKDQIDSTEKLKNKMPSLVAKLKDPQQFKEFYRYIFMFAKDPEQKCMPLEASLS
ncbi:DCN1-like protein 4 [Entomortierella lignicola]|nr:DCN1-like protein 4 [Entomortierella lignicola]